MTKTMTPWERLRPWVSTLARIALGGVLITAGALKLPDPEEAIRAVRAYRLLPEAIVPVVGLGLPAFEVALGIVLVLGLFTRIAAILGSALMVVFIAGIISAWTRGLSIDCGCFGGGGQVAPGSEQYVADILRDTGFLLLGVVTALWPRSPLSVDRFLAGPATTTQEDVDSLDDEVDDADHDDLPELAPSFPVGDEPTSDGTLATR